MPQIDRHSSKPVTAVLLLVLLLASIALGACGGSSNSSTTSASAAAATSTAPAPSGTTAPGTLAGRFAALRECLQKNGITLPKRTPGQARPPGGGFLGGGGTGPTLPQGVTRAQYEAAVKKCGGFARGGFGGGARVASPHFKEALAKFAACMNENGIKLPAPNTSGKGPIFNASGLNTSSAQFKAAETKCRSVLTSSFRAAPGAGGGTQEPGAPPAAG